MIAEFAPAKLNLYLHVLGRDQRGYHLLDSLVAFADIGDELTIAVSAQLSLTIDGPFAEGLDAGPGNLVWRAAQALAVMAGRKPDVAITLTKNLPVASGIGGGSADAAAALRALCRLWGIAPTSDGVMQIARSLGADIPVCVAAQPCFMGGVGEILDPCPPLPPVAIVLVNPGFACATKDVFAARQGPYAPDGRFDVVPKDAAELAQILEWRSNGLTSAAVSLHPGIDDVLAVIGQQTGCLLPRMLGSGATCLGLFATAPQAEAAAAAIAAHDPAWWVRAGRLL
jgi:4-diphosphocytidyl-2-C-methyl-D-erythritol kinase